MGVLVQLKLNCPCCDGDGHVEYFDRRCEHLVKLDCSFCRGSGWRPPDEEIARRRAERNYHFILAGRETFPVSDYMQWAVQFEDSAKRRVAQDEVNGARVSTVFLGLNHQFGDGPPLLFETMIFGGWHDQYQDRYATWDEAEIGHAQALRMVRMWNGVPVKVQRVLRKPVDWICSQRWRLYWRVRRLVTQLQKWLA